MRSLLLLVIAVISYAAGENFFRSDYTFVSQFNGWFKFHRASLPWHLARRRCNYEGAKLDTPMDKDHVTMFRDLMFANNVSAMYTGAHDTFRQGEFQTIDGIPYMDVSQNRWRRDGMTYSWQADRCAAIDDSGLLFSATCEDAYPFLCFKTFEKLNITECGTSDPEYVYQESTGSCYKLHRTYVDWKTAGAVCSAEGGYLAIPADEDEAQLLANMTAEDAYIGYVNWERQDMDAAWYTVHGEPIPYNRWNLSGDGMRYCGAVQNDKPILVRFYCSTKKLFICEKNPKSLSIHNRRPAQ